MTNRDEKDMARKLLSTIQSTLMYVVTKLDDPLSLGTSLCCGPEDLVDPLELSVTCDLHSEK